MKNLFKKATILCMSCILCLLTINLHTYAAEETVNYTEYPNEWATEEIKMLQIYDIADSSVFTDYTSYVTSRELYSLGIKLYEKITETTITDKDILVDDVALIEATYKVFNVVLQQKDLDTLVSRETVINVLYNVIKNSAPTFNYSHDYIANLTPTNHNDSVKYLVYNKLLNGISKEELGLNRMCTKEQLFALASRTYYYIIQKLDIAAKGMFFKVQNETNTVYLLGSIHLADSSIYPMNDDILNAYDESDVLSVEAILSEEELTYMQANMFYQDGTTVDQVLSEETYKLYADKMASYDIEKNFYDSLKPWAASFTISGIEAAESSMNAELGIDNFFMSKANKPIEQMEGLKFQTDLFNSFDNEIQESMLLSSLTSEDDSNPDIFVTELKKMLSAWKLGNIIDLESTLGIDENTDDIYSTKLLFERNKHMYEVVLDYLNNEEGKTYFVVVGAAHVITDDGIVKRLKDAGYEVNQIK